MIPAWCRILEAAEAWGKAPWEVEEGPAHWYLKWQAYEQAKEARAKVKPNG